MQDFVFTYKCPVCGGTLETDRPPADIHICRYCGKIDISLYSAKLYRLDLKSISRILIDELARRKLKDKVGVIYFWKTREGEILKLHKMTTSHIENLQGLVERTIFERTFGPDIPEEHGL